MSRPQVVAKDIVLSQDPAAIEGRSMRNGSNPGEYADDFRHAAFARSLRTELGERAAPVALAQARRAVGQARQSWQIIAEMLDDFGTS